MSEEIEDDNDSDKSDDDDKSSELMIFSFIAVYSLTRLFEIIF